MKTFKMKKFLTLVLAAMMLVTSLPVGLLAKTDYNYDNLDSNKSDIVNGKLPVEVAKPDEGKTAEDLIKNPAMPKLYTMRADYKLPRNDEEVVGYQPYIATVGDDEYTYTDLDGNEGQKVLTGEEKSKIKKKIDLPDIDGYTSPTPSFTVNYDYIKANANKKENLDGDEYKGEHPYLYEPKQGTIKIKHTFQKLEDLGDYGLRDGDTNFIYTNQTGVTGTSVTIKALDEDIIKGYVPEVNVLTTQVPQNRDKFEIEMRYNRAIFDVTFDSAGGTDLPGMTLFYGQTIPKLNFDIEKLGSNLQGWKVNKDINYTDKAGTKQTLSKDTLIEKADFEAGGKFETGIKYAMPASELTFTAQWKDKDKADYTIQFWAEKSDYDEGQATELSDKYDFVGVRVVKDKDTGTKPDLNNLSIDKITFPDLSIDRMEKAWTDSEFFDKFYDFNQDLTKKENVSEKGSNEQKEVLSTGETVYNVYYDRRVYTLYFTKQFEVEDISSANSFFPTITRDGQVIGKEGDPYKVNVRFNQSLKGIWPKDEEVSGLPALTEQRDGDTGLLGWVINVNSGIDVFRDTPPYRLSAEDFIDSEEVENVFDEDTYDGGSGHSNKIPIADGQNKDRAKYEISVGATSYENSVVHHIDIIKDDFDGNEQIDYDLAYWKSDTDGAYQFGLPHLQGFTLKKEKREAEWIYTTRNGRGTRTFDMLNADREKITPFRSDDDKF